MANWNLDTAHSEIEFRVKHMMITTLKGQFENFDVQFENEGSDFQTAKISA
ncbi:MAG: YceI family protein, partial [Sphingobacteriaceae bacterium]